MCNSNFETREQYLSESLVKEIINPLTSKKRKQYSIANNFVTICMILICNSHFETREGYLSDKCIKNYHLKNIYIYKKKMFSLIKCIDQQYLLHLRLLMQINWSFLSLRILK